MLSAATADPLATCSARHAPHILHAEMSKLFNPLARRNCHVSHTSILSCKPLSSSNTINSSSRSRNSSRRAVIVHDKKPNRNPYLELEKDLLPDGKPNTPWRRLQMKIRSTTSLQGLIKLYLSNRHKSAVWRPIHSAGILMRIAALHYYRVILPPYSCDERTSLSILQLLNLVAPDLTSPSVLHVMDAARLTQVLVVLAALNLKPPAEVLDLLIRELMREGFKKLPASKPDLLAELAAALAKLQWREKEVWLAIAAAAKGQLRTNQLQRHSQQAELEQIQQQQQWSPVLQQDQQQQQSPVLQQNQQQQQQQWSPNLQQYQQQQRWSPELEQYQQQQQQWSSDLQLNQQQQGIWQYQQQPWQQSLQQQQEVENSIWKQQQQLQQQDPWQQPQQQQQQQSRDKAAIVDSQLIHSTAIQGAYMYENNWEEHSENEYELREEEWYEEDPAYWSCNAVAADNTPFSKPQQQQQQQQQVVQAVNAQPYSSSSSRRSPASATRQTQLQQSTPWLSMCYPKMVAAVATAGLEDVELMQLLGDSAVHVLPLLTQRDLADLASAYAKLGVVHVQLLHAVSLQLQQNVEYLKHSSSSRRRQQQQEGNGVAAVIQTAHALGELGFADVLLLEAVQTAVLSGSTARNMPAVVMPSGSTVGSTAESPARSTGSTTVGPEQYVQILQLLVQSGCLNSSSSSNGSSSRSTYRIGPLIRWVCTAISASGLEALQPSQLAAAAVALVELQQHPEAAGAAAVVGAAATARAQESGPEVLADVLWCCVTFECANMVAADVAVAVVEQAAEQLQQQQQQQQKQRHESRKARRKGNTKGAAKQVAAVAAATGFGLLPGTQQQQQQQQHSVLSPRHQAQLVLSLQRMGRIDLVQRVVSACQVGAVTSL